MGQKKKEKIQTTQTTQTVAVPVRSDFWVERPGRLPECLRNSTASASHQQSNEGTPTYFRCHFRASMYFSFFSLTLPKRGEKVTKNQKSLYLQPWSQSLHGAAKCLIMPSRLPAPRHVQAFVPQPRNPLCAHPSF